MVFSSAAFLFGFLPAVLLLVYPLPRRAQNYGLLLMSVLFYIWGAGDYIAVIASVSVGSWLLGKWVVSHPSRKAVAAAGVILVSLPLLYFKYAPVIGSVLWPSAFDGSLFLPLGISFFTFHAISYVVDVWRGTIEPARNLGHYLLYLFLFPHQIAGPIVRFREISEEIASRLRATSTDVLYGLARFGWGLAKKTVVADNAGSFADTMWANTFALNTQTAWLTAFAYAVQIYFDFSAYSDMALGIARIFNFHFPENFAGPYRSRSATEFWARWHMTLSRWFRDYVYIPFGGNRHGRKREYAGLLLTFLLTSLWHGAFWHFLVWGGMWSALLLFERITNLRSVDRFTILRRLFMFIFIVVSWVPFRSTTMDETVQIWKLMFSNVGGDISPVVMTAMTPLVIMSLVVGLVPFLTPRRVQTRTFDFLVLTRESKVRLKVAFVICVVGIALGAAFSLYASFSPFLYYQF